MYALPQAFRKRTTPLEKSGSVLTGHLTEQETERRALKGIWHSEGGSLYICDGQTLICISVHSAEFRGWVGKVAVRSIHCTRWNLARLAGVSEQTGWCVDGLAVDHAQRIR